MKYTTTSIIICALLLGVGCARLPTPEKNVSGNESPSPVTDWRDLSPGMSYRIFNIGHDSHQYQLHAIRLNNENVQWNLGYSATPLRLQSWLENTEADLVINGSFFAENFNPTGAFTVDGEKINAEAYTAASAGTVLINQGALSLVNTVPSSLKADQSLFQSFPFLMAPDGKATIDEDTEKIARRTIIAADKNHVYAFVFDTTPITLFDASRVLTLTDLPLDWALNLDGGPSSGLIAKGSHETVTLLPGVELPIVLSAKMISPAAPNGQ